MAIIIVLVAGVAVAGGENGFGSSHIPGNVEANFLVNLFRFVAWPHAATDKAVICFVRPSAVQARLESGVSQGQAWAQLPGRKIVVRILTDEEIRALAMADDKVGCQILFLDPRAAEQFWPQLSSGPMPAALLTVSTQRNFAYSGGMIQFLWESGDTYRILINPVNVARADVVVSGALGTLADRVDDARFHNR
jgi:uncharacterized protein DUF4154